MKDGPTCGVALDFPVVPAEKLKLIEKHS